MFSFFSEVCDFFSQVAYLFNWAFNYVFSFLSASSDTVEVFSDFSGSLPPVISWMIPASIGALVFHFIRGHW